MAAFEYRQAQEIRDTLLRYGVRYLFIGKSGAILLGFPDTTQDTVLFVDRSPSNGRALALALAHLGFALSADQVQDIERGRDFVQLKNGPFDLDLVFAPDGIERFADAWARRRRRLPRVPPRRHHRQQGRCQSREGPRESAPAACVPRLLDGAALIPHII